MKVLTPSTALEAVADFENEAVLLRRLNTCKGVVSYVDGGEHPVFATASDGTPFPPINVRYHVLALASGSLDELLDDPDTRSQLPWDERMRLWRSAVKCVMQMHQGGVAHRDLKASNCLLMVRKNSSRIQLADLGRGRDLTVPASRPAQNYLTGQGDFRFAPPEALYWQGGTSKDDFLAIDYYGLGSLLVELISGQSITALAIGDFGVALREGHDDFMSGRVRDLGVLDLKYRNVIAQLAEHVPVSIRQDVVTVLTILCHPEPDQRLSRSPYRRDRASHDRLAWVLRRADIMIRRLQIEARIERNVQKATA